MDAYEKKESLSTNQLNDIDHPNVKCCLDISHGYLNCTYRNAHFIDEIKNMAPLSEHIHMHDSHGMLLKSMWTWNKTEAGAYGKGDLHLPLGWGDIPFEKIFTEMQFPEKLCLNFEVLDRYQKYFNENIKEARRLLEFQKQK